MSRRLQRNISELKNSSHQQTLSLMPNAWVEPSPDWLHALKSLKWLWHLHVYGFAMLFLLVSVQAIASLVDIVRSRQRNQKTHFIVTNVMLFNLGFLRSLLLFVDPYLSSGTKQRSLILSCVVGWGIAKACLTSAFTIMLLIFLETTRITIIPLRLQSLSFLISVAFVHVAYLTLSNVVVIFYPEAKIMIFICQVVFAIWGLLTSVGYFAACSRMKRNLIRSLRTEGAYVDDESRRLSRLFSLMCAASAFGALKFVLSTYMASSEHGILSDMGKVESWSWFVTQSCLRVLELLMSAFVCLVGQKNKKKVTRRVVSLPMTCQNGRPKTAENNVAEVHENKAAVNQTIEEKLYISSL